MAYMRGNPYIYSDGINLNIVVAGAEVALPLELADDLAAMIWHRKSPEEQREILARVAANYDGNFGADGVMKALGRPTVMETVAEEVKFPSLRRDDDYGSDPS